MTVMTGVLAVAEQPSEGPLRGIRVLELGGIGPVQFAGMVLADLGADVARLERPGYDSGLDSALSRGRSLVGVDLTEPDGLAGVRHLARYADVILEGFRPGVAERMGVGPERLRVDNPKVIYGRVCGWGRTGPLAAAPGHDINYIALAGALSSMCRPRGVPVVSPGFVGDFGGAGMALTVGVLSALLHARNTRSGQVVDCSITGGSAWLTAALLDQIRLGGAAAGLATGYAPFYNVYACRDDRFVAVGAYERPFYEALREMLGLDAADWDEQFDHAAWPARVEELAVQFSRRDRDDWASHPLAADACVTPVLSPEEAQKHEQNTLQHLFLTRAGSTQPNPAPRFSDTPSWAASKARREDVPVLVSRWAGGSSMGVPGEAQ